MTRTNPNPVATSGQGETPRTDARKFKIVSDLQSGTREVVDADLAEDLERTLAETQERLTALREAVENAIKEIEGEAELNDGYAQCEVIAGNVVKETGYRNAAAAYRVCAIELRKATTPPSTALRNAADSTKGEQ